MTWAEIADSKQIRDLPGKVEFNARGQIIMSPTRKYHGRLAYRIARTLDELMQDGEVLVECAVETADGVKEADAAWLNPTLSAATQDAFAVNPAPDICVEVLSPSNTEEEMQAKRLLFIGAGAKEYWLCDKEGVLRFFDGQKELEQSQVCPLFPKQLPKE
jgi:Uma2 family endonuclease